MSTKSIVRLLLLTAITLGLYSASACVPPQPDFSCLRCASKCPGGLTCSSDGYCLPDGETSAYCGVAEAKSEAKTEPITDKAEPTKEGTPEPRTEPRTEPTDEPTSEPATEPHVEPRTEPTGEPDALTEPATEPVAEPQEPDAAGEPGPEELLIEVAPEDPEPEPQPDTPTCQVKDGTPCTSGTGECTSQGVLFCDNGILRCNAPTISPKPESCDGKDNDCDGKIDNVTGKSDKLKRDCYNLSFGCVQQGNAFSCKGLCEAGTQTCSAGRWGACPGGVYPKPELCNGKDDNCDGQVDDGLTCICTPGAKEACYPGNLGCTKQTNGNFTCTAPCKAGSRTCDTKGAWGACQGAQEPQAEICDGKDNNCDGNIDEIFTDKGQSCTLGIGTCQRKGKRICATDGKATVCDATPGTPATEICDEKDNDCDGQVDEGFTTQTYYRDLDRDTFGDPKNTIKRCKVPAGYVTNATDCYDKNANAKPGQTNYYSVHRGDGSFDYDCNGTAERKPLKCTSCKGTEWKANVTSCGTPQPTQVCVKVFSSCTRSGNQSKVQNCH